MFPVSPSLAHARARARTYTHLRHTHTLTHRHTRARKSRLCRDREPTRSKAAWEKSPGVSSEPDTCQGGEARGRRSLRDPGSFLALWPRFADSTTRATLAASQWAASQGLSVARHQTPFSTLPNRPKVHPRQVGRGRRCPRHLPREFRASTGPRSTVHRRHCRVARPFPATPVSASPAGCSAHRAGAIRSSGLPPSVIWPPQ